ncbi:deoxyribodipyrimidine photo-lyase [Acidothermaceae bacterium B102]|nr:deoxyribodipyrimidine photo-lyase [Acidothermaceae bacterium B102]
MTTAILVYGRDLRVADHPALAVAATYDTVIPLFVLDEAILAGGFNRPNRAAMLAAALEDVDASLRRLGAGLVVRRGDWVTEIAALARSHEADAVVLHSDVSGYAQSRTRKLAAAVSCRVEAVEGGTTAVPPGKVLPSGGSRFQVFTPYHRAWEQALPWREIAETPKKLRLPDGVDRGSLPTREDICPAGDVSPELDVGGEAAGRKRVSAWLAKGVERYEDLHDDLAADGTSRLSGHLHFGTLSAYEIVGRSDHGKPGVGAFNRQLCWRDFHAQVLAASPEATHQDYRPHGDRWRNDDEGFEAWAEGRTGYPIVDAGMRQLAREGYMHNRARLITGSFLTKTLYIDWRRGAQHFADLLVDGDVSNNTMNWQWIAGTGTDSRPGRVLNPLRQAERYDPQGEYVRRYVPELAGIEGFAVHEPWKLSTPPKHYPEPIVDLREGAERFKAARST